MHISVSSRRSHPFPCKGLAKVISSWGYTLDRRSACVRFLHACVFARVRVCMRACPSRPHNSDASTVYDPVRCCRFVDDWISRVYGNKRTIRAKNCKVRKGWEKEEAMFLLFANTVVCYHIIINNYFPPFAFRLYFFFVKYEGCVQFSDSSNQMKETIFLCTTWWNSYISIV